MPPIACTDDTCDLSVSGSPTSSLSSLPLRVILHDDINQNWLALPETPSPLPLASLFMKDLHLLVLQLPSSQTSSLETPLKIENSSYFERSIPSLPTTPESPPNSSKSKQLESKSTKLPQENLIHPVPSLKKKLLLSVSV
jgi:hypothetical protein